jgi:phage terminase large subunit-like protein
MEHPRRWIALVARAPADARDYMIEGPGGILRNSPPQECPLYEPSKRRLTWPNGSWATIYSDEEPDQCRGFSGDTAWLDEFAKFQNPTETWTNLAFGMRESSNDQPRRLITTTPRPIPILTQIEAMPTTVVVTGSSYENKDNLDPRWFTDVLSVYEGTRIGRQEIMAEILEDVPGALWTRAMLDRARFNCGAVEAIRKGDAPVPSEQQVSTFGVWAG